MIRVSAAVLLAAASVASAQSIQNVGDVSVVSSPAPANPSSPWAPSNLMIGRNGGAGATYVSGGATINWPGFISVSFVSGSSGLLRVSDFGSNVNAFFLTVGSGGSGRMDLLNGGRATAQSIDIGWSDGTGLPPNGVVNVDGAGSMLKLTSAASTMSQRVAASSTLNITNGGSVDSVGEFQVAYISGEASDMGNATINVTGAGSHFHLASALRLGQAATGSATLNIGEGASVSTSAGYVVGKTGVVNLDGGVLGLGTGAMSTNNGAIRGRGTLTGTITNFGTISVDAGKEIRVNADRVADQFLNRGRVENFGGSFVLNEAGSNQSGSQIVGRDAYFRLADPSTTNTFNNIGQIAFTGGANDLVGGLQNSSKILIDGNSVVTFHNAVNNSSELKVNAGSKAIFLGTFSGNSVVTGSGATFAMSRAAPGEANSAGTMSFAGDVTLDPAARLAIDLGGVTVGTQTDRVASAARATIAGATLELSTLDGYSPALYTPHRVVQAGTLGGTFGAIHGVALSPTKYLAVTYDATGVTVTAALPGDADLSGRVNFDDLLTLAQGYGRSAGQVWATGDFNGDGATAFEDLLALAQNYQRGSIVDGSASFAADWTLAQSLVPEPQSVALWVVLPRLARRRRR